MEKNDFNAAISAMAGTDVFDSEEFAKLARALSAVKSGGMIPEDIFLKYSLAVLAGGFDTLEDAEIALRVNDAFRSLIGLTYKSGFIQSASFLYSYKKYSAADNFAEYFNAACGAASERFGLVGDISSERLGSVVGDSTIGKPFFTAAPYYYAGDDATGGIICTGGCTETVTEEFDPYTMTHRKIYRSSVCVNAPFFPATRRSITREAPAFPLGSVAGRYMTIPNESGDLNFRDGGMRKRGEFKSDTDEMPLITYVTVVYNGISTVLRCMESIWAQNYPNIEYIVIDGSSKDGTLSLIQEHEDKIDYYVSRRDGGIYDAMNTGISLASGRYICFMNADDTAPPDAAKTVAENIEDGVDMIYGTILLRGTDGTLKPVNSDMVSFLLKNNVVRTPLMFHQAVYGSRRAFDTVGGFDLGYRIAADLKWTSLCVRNGLVIKQIDAVLAHFSLGGASDSGRERTSSDTQRLQNELLPELSPEFCEQLFFFLKRSENEQYRSFMPLFGAAAPYMQNSDVVQMIYYTMLYEMYEELGGIVKRWSILPYQAKNEFLERAYILLNKAEGWKVIEHPVALQKQIFGKLSSPDANVSGRDIQLAAELKELMVVVFAWIRACVDARPSTLIYDRRREFDRIMSDIKRVNSSAASLLEVEKKLYFEN